MSSFLPSMEELEGFRQDSYEASTVEFILRWMKRLDLKADIKAHHDSIEGKPRLGLSGLRSQTEFPLSLATRKISWIGEISLVELLTRPTLCPAVQIYAELAEEYPDAYETNTLGLVFFWPKWTKFAVIHNAEHLVKDRGRRIIWYAGRKRVPRYIETLESLLSTMDTDEPTDE